MSELNLDLKRRYFMEFGSESNAYFHFQDALRDFHLPGKGVLTYHQQSWLGCRVSMVFQKPLCSAGNLRPLIEAFLALHHHRSIFIGMDEPTARVLEALGFSVTEFGVEFNVPIPEFRVRGRGMKHLRNVQHYGTRGVEVKELAPAEVPWEDVARITQLWLNQQPVKHREMRFLTRPPVFEPEWQVRKFYCFVEGRLAGFVFFDPFFRSGRCIGYCANILRSEPGLKPAGILDYALLEALAVFREEGIEWLALGLCPLHDVQPQKGEDPLLRICEQQLYRRGSFLYHFKELAFHKSRYRGHMKKLYVCKRGLGPLATLGLSLKAVRVL